MIDWSKPIECCSSWCDDVTPARLVTRDPVTNLYVVAVGSDGDEIPEIGYVDDYGRFDGDKDTKPLIRNVKNRLKGCLNIYPGGHTSLHNTRASADLVAMEGRVLDQRFACIEIDVEEGEGL